ncbi:hypothetical protein KFE25_011559 [Diacronema lutheri]|uniref:AP2/ERF domain-containing protein n=1 Tax=Diacronema lutheri TaxID=2081491 RepID=A0A8J5XKC3_DIALT|nr:hypothetical protein KFE25_011559 [Diacronema lutheri]
MALEILAAAASSPIDSSGLFAARGGAVKRARSPPPDAPAADGGCAAACCAAPAALLATAARSPELMPAFHPSKLGSALHVLPTPSADARAPLSPQPSSVAPGAYCSSPMRFVPGLPPMHYYDQRFGAPVALAPSHVYASVPIDERVSRAPGGSAVCVGADALRGRPVTSVAYLPAPGAQRASLVSAAGPLSWGAPGAPSVMQLAHWAAQQQQHQNQPQLAPAQLHTAAEPWQSVVHARSPDAASPAAADAGQPHAAPNLGAFAPANGVQQPLLLPNVARKIKTPKWPKSQFVGVSSRQDGKFKAVVVFHGQSMFIGAFPSEVEASLHYDVVAAPLGKRVNDDVRAKAIVSRWPNESHAIAEAVHAVDHAAVRQLARHVASLHLAETGTPA